MAQSDSSKTTSDALLSLADDLSAFSVLAKRIQRQLLTLTPAKDGTYLKLVQDTIAGKQDVEERRFKKHATVDDVIAHLDTLTNS